MAQRAQPRILQEARELQKTKSSLLTAWPLEDNIFEWHFTIRGPKGTEYEGGIYHGRIILPTEYPNKPPDIIFSTPNGRFEVEKKICLTISSHHPESWQPTWGIRTALLAIIAFMPTRGDGAIASLDWPPEERKRLAKLSLGYSCPKCGAHNLTTLPPADDEQIDLSLISDIQLKNKEQQEKDDKEKAGAAKPADDKGKSELVTAEQPKETQPKETVPITTNNHTTPTAPTPQMNPTPPATEMLINQENVYNLFAPQRTSSFYSSYSPQEKAEILEGLDRFIVFIFCLLGLLVFRKLV